jgi:hypothetical protein
MEGTFYLNDIELGKETVEEIPSIHDDTAKYYENLLGIDSIELDAEFDKKHFYKVLFNKKIRQIYNRLIHAKSKRQLKKQFKRYIEE